MRRNSRDKARNGNRKRKGQREGMKIKKNKKEKQDSKEKGTGKGKGKGRNEKKKQDRKDRNHFPGKLVCLLVLVFSSEPICMGKRSRLSPRAQDLSVGAHRLSREHTKISAITNHQNRRTLDCRLDWLFTSLKRGGLFLHLCDQDLFIAASE